MIEFAFFVGMVWATLVGLIYVTIWNVLSGTDILGGALFLSSMGIIAITGAIFINIGSLR